MKKLLISQNLKIFQVMKKLGATGERILFVVDSKHRLLGTITDGDIRRGILLGMKINESIKSLYFRKPKVLLKGKYTVEKARNFLRDYKQNALPIIDENNCIVNYFTWKEAFGVNKKQKNLIKAPVIVMAGGKGDRLLPFTKVLPKPLIPINDKTVIEHIIEKFTFYGAKSFFITVNYKSRILKSFFQELQPNYSVNFFDETIPLGTVGGLRAHKSKFKEPFFVTNCDIIVDLDYADFYNFHKKNKNDLTLVASARNFEIPYGICELDNNGKLSKINEKPKQNFLANTGLYILNPKVLSLIPKNKFYHMTQLIHEAKKAGMNVGIYPIDDKKWVDVGQWSEYRKNIKKL